MRIRWPISVVIALTLGLSGLAAPSGVGANDDLRTEANGPMANGRIYQDTIGTENDVDWWVFYTGTSTAVDVALMGLGPEDCFGPKAILTDGNGERLSEGGRAERNQTQHILYTVPAGTSYIQVVPVGAFACSGPDAVYRVWVNASSTLLAIPPYIPPPPAPVTTPTDRSAIRAAKACEHAQGRVSGLARKLRRARGANYRRLIRQDLRRARAAVARRC
jgi:hypothetical protein